MCDAASSGVWDIALVGADPARESLIHFTDPYVEIQATYMVPVDSHITSIEAVDSPGTRVATKIGAAYDLWLERNLKHAALVRADTLPGSYEIFYDQKLEALAGIRSMLVSDLEKSPGSHRVLDGKFMAVQQAIGSMKREGDAPGKQYLADFVEDVKVSGLVQDLINKHGVASGLSVAS